MSPTSKTTGEVFGAVRKSVAMVSRGLSARYATKEKEAIVKIYRDHVVFGAFLVLSMPLAVSADSLKLYAAGSLQAALGDVAAAYEKTYKTQVTTPTAPMPYWLEKKCKPLRSSGYPKTFPSEPITAF